MDKKTQTEREEWLQAGTRQEAMTRVLAAHPKAEHISKIETRKPE